MTTEVLGGSREQPELTKLGPYRLVQQLGEGGMGVVHLALDRSGRAVAIKVLRPHVAHDPEARARLSREVETLRRISDERVAPVVDADVEGDRPYIVTRYVPGPPLDEVVKARGPLEGDDLLRLADGLYRALRVIHEADVVHRDLKPGNVLLLDGEPVLIDFGIAHVADDVRLTMTGMVMGTPGYLAPEVVEGETVSEATDWWGWAATLAFAASGVPPFGRGPMDAVLARVARGEADLSTVDPELAPLLAAALSPDPEERPSADQVLAGLEQYAAGEPVMDVVPVSEAALTRTQIIEQRSTATMPPVPAPRPAEVEPYAEADDDADGAAGELEGAGQGDPRAGLPRRTALLALVLAAMVVLAAGVPMVAVIVMLAWSVVARTADGSVTSLVLRRHERGVRRGDLAWTVAAGPWHVVMGIVRTLTGALAPLLVGASTVLVVALVMLGVTGGGSPQPNHAVPLGAAGLLAALTAWWGPGGAGLRRGSRTLVRGMTPNGESQKVFAVVLGVIVTGAALYLLAQDLVPSWSPLSSPPGPFGSLTNPLG